MAATSALLGAFNIYRSGQAEGGPRSGAQSGWVVLRPLTMHVAREFNRDMTILKPSPLRSVFFGLAACILATGAAASDDLEALQNCSAILTKAQIVAFEETRTINGVLVDPEAPETVDEMRALLQRVLPQYLQTKYDDTSLRSMEDLPDSEITKELLILMGIDVETPPGHDLDLGDFRQLASEGRICAAQLK